MMIERSRDLIQMKRRDKRHLRSCSCYDDAVDLEFSRPLPGLLLQVQYILFPLMNDLIFPVDLRFLIQALAIQLLDIVILFVQLRTSVHNQAIQLLDVLLHV